MFSPWFMKAKKKTLSPGVASLRSKTEKSLSQSPKRTPKISQGDTEKLINELEAQNQELRVKQREIEEARRRYLDLYDFAPIGYFVFDHRGTIVEANLTGATLLGLPRNQIIGSPFALFVPREFVHPFYEHLKSVFSSNTGQSCELKMSQKYQESVNYVSMESIALETDKLKSNLGKD
jgi:PAS domain S-box-containing protein